ncbi:MAG TPA: hypothetical protein VFV50_13305 [Bdellovibrionales bacterium]|nr:hypothetical protein [Bdellovibrionales bacterium]
MKSFMLAALAALTLSSASANDAPQYPKYVAECREAAIAKMKSSAEFHGGKLDEASVKVSAIDDRLLNPYKYVWFTGVVRFPNGSVKELSALTQKSYLPRTKCF